MRIETNPIDDDTLFIFDQNEECSDDQLLCTIDKKYMNMSFHQDITVEELISINKIVEKYFYDYTAQKTQANKQSKKPRCGTRDACSPRLVYPAPE